jgi:hypothetical protein
MVCANLLWMKSTLSVMPFARKLVLLEQLGDKT